MKNEMKIPFENEMKWKKKKDGKNRPFKGEENETKYQVFG